MAIDNRAEVLVEVGSGPERPGRSTIVSTYATEERPVRL
jgi:hypothetical protein